MPSGQHLVDGTWIAGTGTFQAGNPATGELLAPAFAEADAMIVDQAVSAAEAAFAEYAARRIAERATFLRSIASEMETASADIIARAVAESALPEARLTGELGRTTGQLRFFADWIEAGHCFDARIDRALPDRKPAPRPDIRSVLRPIGPVAVFGASNFPLAFSTTGGDTASALAAGCPVVVKGHPSHPGTAELVARAVLTAIHACGMPNGVFSLIQGAGHASGAALVAHPLIQAVGFTGSLKGGRALFDIAVSRAQPIPFYGELGSINPVFALSAALAGRAAEHGAAWAQSLTLGVGQFCTNPGVVVALDGADLDAFLAAADEVLAKVPAQPMLNAGIAGAYRRAVEARDQGGAASRRGEADRGAGEGCHVAPAVFETTASAFLAGPGLHEEVFGPAALVVRCRDESERTAVAAALEGQLTATLLMEDADTEVARTLLPVLERKAGRLLVNGYSTGVEVCHAMMHGGPCPASTDTRSTSVGSRAILRFLRPVAYQNMPATLLPEGLGDTDQGPCLVDGAALSAR